MLGEMAAEYPDLVKEVAAQGHTIGGHTWSHLNLKRLSDEQARAQIEGAFGVIEKAAPTQRGLDACIWVLGHQQQDG